MGTLTKYQEDRIHLHIVKGMSLEEIAVMYDVPYRQVYMSFMLQEERNLRVPLFFNTKNELNIPSVYTETEDKFGLSSHGNALINRQKIEDYDKFLRDRYIPKNQQALNKSKNFLFGKDYDYKTKNNLRDIYPFYNKIELKHYTNTLFRDKMVNLGIYELFIEDYVQSTKETLSIGGQSYKAFDLG